MTDSIQTEAIQSLQEMILRNYRFYEQQSCSVVDELNQVNNHLQGIRGVYYKFSKQMDKEYIPIVHPDNFN